MKIGPVDIRNHTFTRKMRGVDEQEVRDYLDLVADRLEEVVLDGEELRARIDRLEAEVRDHRALERSLRDSMLSAERLVDDRSAQAEKEAQIVIKNAEVQAGKILLQAREELGRLKAELDDLRRQKVTYVERFRALLRSQGKILEASLETFDADVVPMEPAEPEPIVRASVPPAREPVAREPAPPAAPPASPPVEPPRAEPPRSAEAAPPPDSMSSYVTRSPAVPPPPPDAGPASGRPDGAPWQASGSAQGQEGLFGRRNA